MRDPQRQFDRQTIHISFIYIYRDANATSVWGEITFNNITEEQLNWTYYCVPRRHDYMMVDFRFTGPCVGESIISQ